MATTEVLYRLLWKCAGLAEGEGVEAREELVSMHDHELSRTFGDQLFFTESWIALGRMLWLNRRKKGTIQWPFEPSFDGSGDVDGFHSTSSYRCFILYQTSLLARRAILDLSKRYTTRTGYLPIVPKPASDVERLKRVLRCLWGAQLVEQEERTEIIIDDADADALLFLRQVRDRRYACVRALLCWFAGLGAGVQAAIDSWAWGTSFLEPWKEGMRDDPADESKFMLLVDRSMAIHSIIVRAGEQSSTSGGQRRAWFLYLLLRERFHCTNVRAVSDTPPPPSPKPMKNRTLLFDSDDDEKPQAGQSNDCDEGSSSSDESEEDEQPVPRWEDPTYEGAIVWKTAPPVHRPGEPPFVEGDYEKHPQERLDAVERLTVTSQDVLPSPRH